MATHIFDTRHLPSKVGGVELDGIHVRRRLDAKTRRALAILSHAIRYLEGDGESEESQVSPSQNQLEAIQLIMQRILSVYEDCPPIPPARKWWHRILPKQPKV